jgi:hypothetical protein
MNPVNRLQILYGWTPNYRLVFKKPVLQEHKVKVPQFKGEQGWIFLTYDPLPVCYWIGKETVKLQICLDERLFGDTLFRAERISSTQYVISDLFMYSATNIFRTTTYAERQKIIRGLMTFHKHIPRLVEFYTKDAQFPIKGYEYFDDKKGSMGVYSEGMETVIKSDIPDVYFIRGKEGYVAVPDLKTSEFLRSKGNEFELALEEKNGIWYIK